MDSVPQPGAGQKLQQRTRNLDGLRQDRHCSRSQYGTAAGFHAPQGPYCMDSLTACSRLSGTHPRLSLLHSHTSHTDGKLDVTLCPASPLLHSSKKRAACSRVPACPTPPRCTDCLKTPGLWLSPTHRLHQQDQTWQ